LYAAYLTELYTGLRRGELLGLRWRDVDLKGCKISINQQLITENGKPVISPLKTKGSKRTIAIPGEVSEAIKAYKDFKRAELKDNGFNDIQIKEMLAPDKILFTTSEGTPFEPGNFVRNFKSLLKTVGLPEDLRFHDMRHSFAVISLQQGVDIKTLQSDMGHTSIETTLDRYGHVNEDMKRAAANKRAGTFS
jgi:integrase